MKRNILIFIFTFLCGLTPLFAQLGDEPATWKSSVEKIGDNEYNLVFKATLLPDWHIYSMYTRDGGPTPTSLTREEKDKGERT